ncbi:carbohydrate-binding protein [Flavobacterium pectinovorum]|uniref:carbohydrate-binding protein n=1 Tax=Flavobacterium pectinovorum TaxID=29533 RepID=UPI00265E881F|nr:carbohydrate-binding protein [Flavobacterium pectinovorum]WKL50517.1 carbohydrate-binding protein [Flavobacterium pectinovorum]
MHLDSPTGALLGVLKIKSTGNRDKWISQSCEVKRQAGVHDVYFVFKGTGKDLFDFDWWRFSK